MKIPQIRHVTTYHTDMIQKKANMTFMAFLTANSASYRVQGWIVSGYKGFDSHRYFSNYKKALEFADKNIV